VLTVFQEFSILPLFIIEIVSCRHEDVIESHGVSPAPLLRLRGPPPAAGLSIQRAWHYFLSCRRIRSRHAVTTPAILLLLLPPFFRRQSSIILPTCRIFRPSDIARRLIVESAASLISVFSSAGGDIDCQWHS